MGEQEWLSRGWQSPSVEVRVHDLVVESSRAFPGYRMLPRARRDAGQVRGGPMVGVADRPALADPTGVAVQQRKSAGVLRAAKRNASRLAKSPAAAAGSTGRGVALAISVVRYAVQDTVTGRLPVGEFVWQAWALFKVTATPAVLMAIPIGGIVTVVVSGLVAQVGATALLGAASGVGVLRQGAPVTAGLLMGGAAASAIASDFGARAIREELDAMRVLGVDPVRRLVVPRFLALLLIAPMLTLVIIVSGTASAFLLSVTVSGVAPGSFWNSFGTFAKMTDVYFAIGKGLVFAAIVAIISSMRGMEAKGGPRGVADAVNAAVVINVVLILFANLVITQISTMFFPTAVA